MHHGHVQGEFHEASKHRTVFKAAAVSMTVGPNKHAVPVHQIVLPLAFVVVATRKGTDAVAMLEGVRGDTHTHMFVSSDGEKQGGRKVLDGTNLESTPPVAVVSRPVCRCELALTVLQVVQKVADVLRAVLPLQNTFA